MQRFNRFRTLVLCAMLLPLAASAQTTRPTQTPQPNAALQYWQAFAVMPEAAGNPDVLDNWKTAPLDAAAMGVVASGKSSLHYLHRGAPMQRCDWGLAIDQGLDVQLPHLAKARELACLAALRARYALEHGQPGEAVEDIAGIFALARHVGTDNILISVLTQCALENIAIDVTADHLLSLDGPARTALAARMRSLPPGGSVQDCFGNEKDLCVQFLVKLLKASDGNDGWVHKVFVATGVTTSEAAEAAVKAAGGTPQAVITCLNDLDPYFKQVPALFALPEDQFQAQYAALTKKFDANPMAKLVLSPYSNVYYSASRTRARVAMLQAAIAVSLDGHDKLKDFQDPFGQGPFQFRLIEAGFELQSVLTRQSDPVTLTVR